MAYEVINHELGVYSCSISDLTFNQVGSFLKQWDDGSNIGSLTVFYDTNEGRIVINKDNELYDNVLKITIKYIGLSQTAREKMKNEIRTDVYKKIIDVIDLGLMYREVKKEKELFEEKIKDIKKLVCRQTYPADLESTMDILDELYDSYSPSISHLLMYQYGLIQGKRAERAKKKLHKEN